MGVLKQVISGFVVAGMTAMVSFPAFTSYCYSLIFARKRLGNARTPQQAARGIEHPKVKGVVHETADCEGCRIHIARAGINPTKKCMLFIHGFPEFWYSWRAQLEALQEEYEVAAIDMPGYNASDQLPSQADYVVSNICRIVAAAVTHLGRDTCIVVGHDWGAVVASEFATMYPARVEKLVLLAVPPPVQFAKADLRQRMASIYFFFFTCPWLPERVLQLSDFKMINGMFSKLPFGTRRRTLPQEEIEHYKNAVAVPGALTGALNYYRASVWNSGVMRQDKLMSQARKLNPTFEMPVLVAMGDCDGALLPNLLCNVGKVAPHSVVRVLPNCSHWMQQDAADEVNTLMRLFIENPTHVL